MKNFYVSCSVSYTDPNDGEPYKENPQKEENTQKKQRENVLKLLTKVQE